MNARPSMSSLLLFLLLSAGVTFSQSAPAPAGVTVIRAGTLIDPSVNTPKHNQVIVIRSNNIESVGDAASAHSSGSEGHRPLECHRSARHDRLAHPHLSSGRRPGPGWIRHQLLKFPLAYRAARATVSARRALEQGFTTIRDMETEGAGYGDVGIKMAVNEGRIPGPRIFTTTRAISTTGGYPLEGYAPEIEVPKGAQIIDGPVQARKAAREQMDHGADWIKVYMTHRSWVDKDGNLVSQPTLTLEEIKAITDEVHGWGRKVACHAYSGEGLQRALDGGCDSIEHGLLLDDADIAQMKRQGTWYCPTHRDLLQGLVAREHARRQARPRARCRPRAVVQESSAGRAEDRVRHRCRRILLGPAHRAGFFLHGEVRHVADGGVALGDH